MSKIDPKLMRAGLVVMGVAVLAAARYLLPDVPEAAGAGLFLIGLAMRAPGDVRGGGAQ
jgi:hypothetical protein